MNTNIILLTHGVMITANKDKEKEMISNNNRNIARERNHIYLLQHLFEREQRNFYTFSNSPKETTDGVQRKHFHVVCNYFLMDQYNFSINNWPQHVSDIHHIKRSKTSA